MNAVQIAVLAVVQGITEFLPISSSAHLILVPVVFEWADQGLAFDLAVHLGTLAAVLAYFRRELAAMAGAWVASVTGRGGGVDARLAWGLVIATVPAMIVGVVLGESGQAMLRAPWVIATTSVVFGVLLGWIDWRAPRRRGEHEVGLGALFTVGLVQALALIPGSSRAGMTILAGRALGMTRPAAARVSFYLAIPVTAAAVSYETVHLATDTTQTPWSDLVLAAILAAASAFVTIHYFLRLLQRMGLMPFVIYRVVLGIVLLVMFGFG